jgi:hypothetical protein
METGRKGTMAGAISRWERLVCEAQMDDWPPTGQEERNGGPERYSDFFKVTQVSRGRARISLSNLIPEFNLATSRC